MASRCTRVVPECDDTRRELATAVEDRDIARANERSALAAYDRVCELAEDLQSDLVRSNEQVGFARAGQAMSLKRAERYRSERDFLVERFRELAEEFELTAERAGMAYEAAAAGAWRTAARRVTRVVTEATTGHNVTATKGEHDGP